MSGTNLVENNGHVSYLDYQGKHKGIKAWIFSTDHKRIGLLYLISMMIFFAVGVTFGFLMRLELIAPGKTIMDAQTYNSFF
nr:cytochrome c oxidase subunit I [Ignavibacteriaceae bacterium]